MPNSLTNTPSEGVLIVLSGPSGVGKGTVCKALRQRQHHKELVYSISATTRGPRQGEIDGLNYFFKTRQQFQDLVEQNQMLEWAEYVGHYYGTPRKFVEDSIRQGKDVILEIEVQGALKVKEQYDEGIFIFLLPPSLEVLKERITTRGTESEESIRERMAAALDELRMLDHYDYAIVNDEVALACERIEAILTAEHCKRERVAPRIQSWMEEVH